MRITTFHKNTLFTALFIVFSIGMWFFIPHVPIYKSTLSIADLTDNNWSHGVLKDNTKILLVKNNQSNRLFPGEKIAVDTQTEPLVIESVDFSTPEYVSVTLKKPILLDNTRQITTAVVPFSYSINQKDWVLTGRYIIVLLLSISMSTLWVYKKYPLLHLSIATFGIGIFIVLQHPVYSPIDESAHFDYINHIFLEHKLPNVYSPIRTEELIAIPNSRIETVSIGQSYEAVHPPLYYSIGAVISEMVYIFHGNTPTRLYVLRLFNLLLLMASQYVIWKIYERITSRTELVKNNALFLSLLGAFSLSPLFLGILIPVSNESLTLLISSLVFLQTVDIVTKKTPLTYKDAIVSGLLLGLALLTKLTALPICIPIGLAYIYRKSYRLLLLTICVQISLLLPWLVHNWYTYHALTGTAAHIEFVKQIVNPFNLPFRFTDLVWRSYDFFGGMWFSYGSTPFDARLQGGLSLIVLSLLLSAGGQLLFAYKKNRTLKEIIFTIFISTLICTVVLLIVLSFTTPIVMLVGRYLYFNLAIFVCLVFWQTQTIMLPKGQRMAMFIILGATTLYTMKYFVSLIQLV